MGYLVVKYAVTALIVVVVSELAKRADKLGALVSSLPLVTVLTLVWLAVEQQPVEKLANHAYYTFWYVLPTLPMFLLLPWLLRAGQPLWLALGWSAGLTMAAFALTAWAAKALGVDLWPSTS